ncbi:MAG: DHHA1 domain-containing protein [Bacillota bacterium]
MYCIYHSNDNDGRCSAAIVKHFLPNIQLIPYDHGRYIDTNVLKGNTVYIVDISLEEKEMTELSESCDLIWIDHHKTSIEKYKSLNIGGKQEIGKAACQLCWEYFSENEIPLVVKIIANYDVWNLSFKFNCNGENFTAESGMFPFDFGVKSYPIFLDGRKSFIFWEKLFSDESLILSIIKDGQKISSYLDNQNSQLAKSYSFETKFHGYKTIALNMQPGNSRVLKSIENINDYEIQLFFALINDNKRGLMWKISCYTAKDYVDVSEIAVYYKEKYGISGGGHKQAAGFVIPGFKNLRDILEQIS